MTEKECCKADEPCCKEETKPEAEVKEQPKEPEAETKEPEQKIMVVEKQLIKGLHYIIRLKTDPNCQRAYLKRVTDKCYQFILQNGDEWWQTHEVFHNNFDIIEKFKR